MNENKPVSGHKASGRIARLQSFAAQRQAELTAWITENPDLDPAVWFYAPADRRTLLQLARKAEDSAVNHEEQAAADRSLAKSYRARADSLKNPRNTGTA